MAQSVEPAVPVVKVSNPDQHFVLFLFVVGVVL